MSESADTAPKIVTVLAEEFTAAAMEYHRREMGKKGYELSGQIRQHSFLKLDGPGQPAPLFDGKPLYAATFVLKDAAG